tara:strand:- start:389 stop:559 length:171 start_codon:yes stop_codon:yes gene_type:complete
MTTHNPDQKRDKLDELLKDDGFIHDLIMGKYGYHPDLVTAKVNALIDELIQEGGGD